MRLELRMCKEHTISKLFITFFLGWLNIQMLLAIHKQQKYSQNLALKQGHIKCAKSVMKV